MSDLASPPELTVADLAKDLSWASIPGARIHLLSSGRTFDAIERDDGLGFCLLSENRGRLRRHYARPSEPIQIVDRWRQPIHWP